MMSRERLAENAIAVAALLHSRGRETTPSDVIAWAEKMVARMLKYRGKDTTCDQWLRAALDQRPTATMCLHLQFGDSL